MNEETQTVSQDPTVPTQKRLYSRPVLVNYGAVRLLTQSGSKNGNENQGNTQGTMAGSDRAIKQNIAHIGDHPLGFGVYLFDYKPEFKERCGLGRQFGVMADEVEAVVPGAVQFHPDGYKMVNYGMLGINRIQ